MHSVVVPSSSLTGGGSVSIECRRSGHGPALVFLHGGWGYDIYPMDIEAFTSTHDVVVPIRSGYGRSTPLDSFPADFHYRAAVETLGVLDALGIEGAVWWGHSDGAVIAAMGAIHFPDRVEAVILEAVHYFADKPRSRSFFQRMASEPDSFGPSIRSVLEAEHGAERWRTIMHLDGQAWLELAAAASWPGADLYGDRLRGVRLPALVIHGGRDPRSEPGELEAILAALPQARLSFQAEAGHSPHSESSRKAVTGDVHDFLERLHRRGSTG